MRVFQEEIFGPVLAVTTFTDEADAVRIANDTLYGLGAGVWTRNGNLAYRMGRAIKAGRVWTNCYHLYPAGAAFGGYKISGVGRENHQMMLEHYSPDQEPAGELQHQAARVLLSEHRVDDGRARPPWPGSSPPRRRSRPSSPGAPSGARSCSSSPAAAATAACRCASTTASSSSATTTSCSGEVGGCPFYIDHASSRRGSTPSSSSAWARGTGGLLARRRGGPALRHQLAGLRTRRVAEGPLRTLNESTFTKATSFIFSTTPWWSARYPRHSYARS